MVLVVLVTALFTIFPASVKIGGDDNSNYDEEVVAKLLWAEYANRLSIHACRDDGGIACVQRIHQELALHAHLGIEALQRGCEPQWRSGVTAAE